MKCFGYKIEQAEYETPTYLYIMFGKFLNEIHDIKDCKIELIYRIQSENKTGVIGTFQILNVIIFSPERPLFKLNIPDLFQLIINLKRNDDIIDSTVININIDLNMVYYSRVVDLAKRKFKIILFVECTSRYSDFKIISDHPNLQMFELPNLRFEYLSIRFPFEYSCQTFKLYSGIPMPYECEYSHYKKHIYDVDIWMRQLNIYTLIDHPNIIKMFGYNYDPNRKILFYVEHLKNEHYSDIEKSKGYRNYLAGMFSGMAYLNSCGFNGAKLKSIKFLLDSNNNFKITGFDKTFPAYDIHRYYNVNSNFNFYDYRHDAESAGTMIYSALCHFFPHVRSIRDSAVDSYCKEEKYIKKTPFPIQVILRAMFSQNLFKEPSFFELAILLNLGHFDLIKDNWRGSSDIYNSDYETGNDYHFYLNSPDQHDRFHCLMFHIFHVNLEGINEIIDQDKKIKDEFILYIRNYFVLYESKFVSNKSKRDLYNQFMSLNFNDYRFWLMPPPNMMLHELKQKEPAASRAELALTHFNRFYDERNRDHEYDDFFDNDKSNILQNLETKFFNLCLMFPEMMKYNSLYYMIAHQDIEQADFYYELLNESDQEEIYDLLVQSVINDKEKIKLQAILSLIEKSEGSWKNSKLMSKLLNEGRLSDPKIQFHIGIQRISQLDDEIGIHFLNLSASQNYDPAIFYQALLTFHGYHYEKEQIGSFERMIVVGRRLKWRYAFEVAMVLLQGVDIEQNIEEGLEMLRCAESDYEIPPLVREGLYHVKTPSLYYELIDTELDFYNDNKENEVNDNRIRKNPKYQLNTVIAYHPCFLFQNEQERLNSAIEKDYLEAEFFFSPVTSTEETCDHLLRGAKGGCIESQIFLGLHFIYCSEYGNMKQEGIYWLTVAARQNNHFALEILAEILTHGIDFIPKDLAKAEEYKNQLQKLRCMNDESASRFFNYNTHIFVTKNCSKNIQKIFSRYLSAEKIKNKQNYHIFYYHI